MPLTRTTLARYGLAIASSAAAFLISASLYEPFVRVSPFLLFYAAVALNSWYGGLGPGLTVTALGAGAVAYFLVEPGQLHLTTLGFVTRLSVFVAVGALIAWLNGQLQVARRRCEREAARAARLASSNLVGIYFADLNGRIRDANDYFLRLVGRSREELQQGRLDWRAITAPPYKHVDEHAVRELQTSRVCTPMEKEFERPDGERVPVIWGCAMFDDSNREFINFVLDLTDRRRIEAQVLAHEQRLREMASELMLAEERERRNIATVLHDSVGHTLALAKLKLGSVSAGAGADVVATRIDEVQRLLDGAVEHTRSLTAEISPPVLYELGLGRALQWLGEQLQREHHVEFQFVDDGRPKPLSPEARLVLFRAVRELLLNLVKHARANTCTISVGRSGDSIEVTVEDDGSGFRQMRDIDASPQETGFGLFNIRERVTHLGGRMQILSSPGRGTRVTLIAPLERQEGQRSLA